MQQNPLDIYENTIAELAKPHMHGNRTLQHQAVLSLTRAGSLDFALAEYKRYGLDQVRHHEDIMALGGRLYKDLYLSHDGKKAEQYARQSAERYKAAFEDSQGFYSAINALTMALLGGADTLTIQKGAEHILNILPQTHQPSHEDYYFIEASRAEAYILLGDYMAAYDALAKARDYDPLNFIAHASTLKQFRMIEQKRGENWTWLDDFNPPRAVQFAGHIFGRTGEAEELPVLSQEQENHLKDQVSDIIQTHDIGFGYGALAAGSDIIIAECLLDEGCQLHIILPVSQASFVKASVAPFGKRWVKRFEKCLKRASSLIILDELPGWPDTMLQNQASLVAMGSAIRHAETLSVEAGQLLIWDGKSGAHGTAYDADIWKRSERPQYNLPYPSYRKASISKRQKSRYQYKTYLANSDAQIDIFDEFHDAIKQARIRRQKDPTIRQGILLKLVPMDQQKDVIHPQTLKALPGAIHVCELGADYLTVNYNDAFSLKFMGLDHQGQRVFAICERG